MDFFEFDWWKALIVFVVLAIGFDAYRDYNKTKIELAKIQYGKCEENGKR